MALWLRRSESAHLGEIGKLNTSNLTITPSGTYPSRLWTLDNLGNWSGTESLPGLQFSGSTTDAVTHEVDFANQITRISESTGDRTDFVYDAVGNLVDDGEYIYQYDAWNRLIQVNAHGEIPPTYVEDGSDCAESNSSKSSTHSVWRGNG